MQIALLHTAAVHVAPFEALFHEAAPHAVLRQMVHADLLATAQRSGAVAVRGATSDLIARALEDGADAVLCTCSTLGPVLPDHPRVLRIDHPLMQAAVATGPRIGVALCLDSTRAATLSLLKAAAVEAEVGVLPTVIDCRAAWPFFESGEMAAFEEAIAETVRAALTRQAFDCIVLAQASMRGAAPLLKETGLPVLSSPALAVARAVELASG